MNIRSLNWPFWPFCNYQCLFCFGRFGDIRYTLSKEEHFEVLRVLGDIGVEKLTFTGGEPFLCPFLGDLLVEAKKLDFITMVVSNGSFITKAFIPRYQNFIDWICLSLDSSNEKTEQLLGRGFGNHVANIKKVSAC